MSQNSSQNYLCGMNSHPRLHCCAEHAQIVRGGDDEHPHPRGVRESGQDLSTTASDDVSHPTGRWLDGGREKHLLTCQQLAATCHLHKPIYQECVIQYEISSKSVETYSTQQRKKFSGTSSLRDSVPSGYSY